MDVWRDRGRPENLLGGRRSIKMAWRCDGDGDGQNHFLSVKVAPRPPPVTANGGGVRSEPPTFRLLALGPLEPLWSWPV